MILIMETSILLHAPVWRLPLAIGGLGTTVGTITGLGGMGAGIGGTLSGAGAGASTGRIIISISGAGAGAGVGATSTGGKIAAAMLGKAIPPPCGEGPGEGSVHVEHCSYFWLMSLYFNWVRDESACLSHAVGASKAVAAGGIDCND